MRHITQLLAAAATTLLLAFSAAAAESPPFPRLAGVNNGAPHNYQDPAYQAKLAKLNWSLLAIWVGWGASSDTTMEQVVRNIKAINPNSRVFLYQNSMEVAAGNEAAAPVYEKVDRMKWWAYSRGGAGELLLSPFAKLEGREQYMINNTLFTPRDSAGYQFWEWHARWVVQQFYKPNPSIDGFFEDNTFWRPRVDADWNRDGVIDLQDSPQAGKWLREGYRKRFELFRNLMPGKLMIGNIADWGHSKSVLTELDQTLNGGLIEGIVGASYSVETWASWAEMMKWYRKTMAAVAAPKLVAFHQIGVPTDYKAMRYGLASCLLDNGYYAFTDKAKGYSGVVWFDEYDSKLGQAVMPPATAAWQKGVYRRDFENGIVLVNPKGNGPMEVTLEEDFRRIAGKQDPAVNNGALTRKLVLQDRDGIILKRVKPVAAPPAP
ncbi:MAG TPA: putative glycoside hydrolase, partial [Steroidobacteraceae bacterium]|nr:putative glycoside hydrolase [Steroidobacteraceae bacterium]